MLLAQIYVFAWVLVVLLVLLGLLAVCVPRPRKRFRKPELKKVQYKRRRLDS